jgi:pimeloyl-ACP methyl ester carboxylesterase
MSGHLRFALDGFGESFVLATLAPDVDSAIVFVHGFLGDAHATWLNFPELIDDSPGWERTDLYFLSYDSFRSSVRAGADELARLLDALAATPPEWFGLSPSELPRSLRAEIGSFRLRDRPTTYAQVALVGHSYGGVLVREVVYREAKRLAMFESEPPDAESLAASQLLASDLRLFAPALAGARPSGIKGFVLRYGGVGALASALLGTSESYHELTNPDLVLTPLREATEELARAHPQVGAFRADVLWPTRDEVVADREYRHDRRAKGTPWASNHTTVCKPRHGRHEPLTFVRHGAL